MAQPIWVTPAGNLGTIPEGVFYQTPLIAYEPDLGSQVYFQVVAGELPAGMQCDTNGTIVGVPQAVADIQGVPAEVSRNVTSKFAVRAYTKRTVNGVQVVDRLADRTFSITVTGQDIPEFTTPPGNIGTYYDGTQVFDLQVEYTNRDPDDTILITVASGSLPPGLSISTTGLITGYIEPITDNDAITNFTFVLEISDGKESNLRSFSIKVYSRDMMTADDTEVTADNTFVTADVAPYLPPIIVTPAGNIGRVRSDNFFAYQFEGVDFNSRTLNYVISETPPGLTLDPQSGWLYGYIPNLGLTENIYNFTVSCYEVVDPTNTSADYDYTLTVVGEIDTEIVWLTDSDLGVIDNGATSTLYVEAENLGGLTLLYRLKSGSDSSLPQGLQLLSNGEIAGRVSFDTFALDGGTTTFDVTRTGLNQIAQDPTTFDLKFTFTVNAYSANGFVSVFKDFTVTVNREYNQPYENLYIEAMPPFNDRTFIEQLLGNTSIFNPSYIYRPTDPNFGIATEVVYNHAFGLTASTIAQYVESLNLNHYWKSLILGQIETARALDNDGNVIYEVVYSRVYDNLVNNEGVSVGKEVTLAYPINPEDSTEINTVYPNSLINMRDQVIDVVGQISKVLPLWMTSKQENGRVLGFTPAWVIAYTKPGRGKQVAYNINEQYGNQLNIIDFTVDRYELDRALTKNWDPENQNWIPSPALSTTFDYECHYQLPEPNDSSLVFTGGSGYAVGNQILILGSNVGGTDILNDIIITVNTVDESGTIISAFIEGISPLLSTGNIYYNVIGTNISGTGVGATWDIEVTGGTATIFDGNSIRFIDPVDMYSNTQGYDKYLVFPKRTILG